MTLSKNIPGYEVFKNPDSNRIDPADLPTNAMLLAPNGKMNPADFPFDHASSWRGPVLNSASLPTIGNGIGDVRYALADNTLWGCPFGDATWVGPLGGGSGGGGGGPDIDPNVPSLIAAALATAASDASAKATTAQNTAEAAATAAAAAAQAAAAADASTKANAAVTTAGTNAAGTIAVAIATATTAIEAAAAADATSKANAALATALLASPIKSSATIAAAAAAPINSLSFDTANYTACKIEYLLKRGVFSNQMGSLRVFLLPDHSNVAVSEESVNSGASAGVTFNATLTGTTVSLSWATDNSDGSGVIGEFVQTVFA
jgi:hypothetical protein